MSRAVSPPSSPDQLAGSLAKITISDDNDRLEDAAARRNDVAGQLRHITAALDDIRSFVFEVQELRHASSNSAGSDSSLEDRSRDITPNRSVSAFNDKKAEQSMKQLKEMMDNVSTMLDLSDEGIVLLNSKETASRRDSISSISSLISFDDTFGGIDGIGIIRKPEMLRRQHDELVQAWEALRHDANTLASDLRGDSYVSTFYKLSEQAEELMDSLSKALESCHDVVFAFSRMKSANLTSDPHFSSTELSTSPSPADALLRTKRNFHIKRSTYEPACDQIFLTMDRGLAQHATENGTVLRRFGEQHLRWQSLRERLRRMDFDLQNVEQASPDNEKLEKLRSDAVSPTPSLIHRFNARFSRSTTSPGVSPGRPESRQSKIPRPVAASRPRPSTTSAGSEERPGSALSFTSNSTVRTFRSVNPQRVVGQKRLYR